MEVQRLLGRPRKSSVCRHTLIRTIVLFCCVQTATELCPGILDTLRKARCISIQPACSLFAPFPHSCRCLPTKCASSNRCLAAVPLGSARPGPARPGPPHIATAARANVRPCILFIFRNKTTTKAVRGRRGGGRADLQGQYAKNPGSGSDLITWIKVTLRSRGGSKPIHKIMPRNSATVTKVTRDLSPAMPVLSCDT